MAIERTYGQIKRKFPLLANGLRFRNVSDSANMVVAAVCLFNHCKTLLEDEPDEDATEIEPAEFIDVAESSPGLRSEGEIKRNLIMESLFS